MGRLYHHLAILARPYTLQQFSYYARSLTCMTPFERAKASIMTLFEPILIDKVSACHRSSSFEAVFIKAHGLLFCGHPSDEFDLSLHQIKGNLLDNYIGSITAKFKEQGVFVAIVCIAGLFEHGSLTESGFPKSIFRLAFEEVKANQLDQPKTVSQRLNDETFDMNDSSICCSPVSILEALTPFDIQFSRALISQASSLAFSCLSIALRRIRDKNVLSLVHIYLVFLRSFATVEKAMAYIEQNISWTEICLFLNALIKSNILTTRIFGKSFPEPEKTVARSLFEDFIIRGQIFNQSYFPDTWFKDGIIDDEERILELSSMTETRTERILWLGFCLVSVRFTLSLKITTRLIVFSFIDGSVLITTCRLFWFRHILQSLNFLDIMVD